MAIFIDIKQIAGDAKDMGWKPFSGKEDPAKWYIRADSFSFNASNEAEDDSEEEGASSGSGSGGTGSGASNAPLNRSGRTGGTAGAGAQGTQKKKKTKKGNSITISKKMDYASPSFAKVVMNKQGADDSKFKAYPEAIIYVTSSQREVFLKVTLKNLIVTGYQITVNSGENETSTAEEVTIQYQYVSWVYNETSTTGEVIYTDPTFWWPIDSPLHNKSSS